MKIGLLTFHRADHIGALLQAYALQTAITKGGAVCEFVDLPAVEKPDYGDPIVSNMRNADFFLRKMEAHKKRRRELFDGFRTRYLRISKPYADGENPSSDYDRFIAGSDQVWNYSIPDTDARYFLPFAQDEQCYAYAASFGGDPIPEAKRQFVSERLKHFQKISVRERSGQDVVAELTGIVPEICIDPVFLLTAEEWNKLTQPQDEPFVFVYMVQYSEALFQSAKEYAAAKGLGLKVMSATFDLRLGFDAWSKYGVTDFLSFARYAECVFTNSYHGTAFSLIYHKPVRTVRLREKLGSRTGRITELLEAGDGIGMKTDRSRAYLAEIIGE